MRRLLVSTVPPPRRIRRLLVPSVSVPIPQSVTEQDRFNAPLYTLGAFAIATAIVISSATASVAGVMAYLDVRNVRPSYIHPSSLLTGVRHRRKNLPHACERAYPSPCRC